MKKNWNWQVPRSKTHRLKRHKKTTSDIKLTSLLFVAVLCLFVVVLHLFLAVLWVLVFDWPSEPFH